MALKLNDIHARLAALGFEQVDTRPGIGTVWEGEHGRFVIAKNKQDALDTLHSIEVLVAGSEVRAGRAQAVEMLELAADSRERYVGGNDETDKAIQLQVNTLRSAIRILQGHRYAVYSLMHSYDWDKFEDVAERHDVTLTGDKC